MRAGPARSTLAVSPSRCSDRNRAAGVDSGHSLFPRRDAARQGGEEPPGPQGFPSSGKAAPGDRDGVSTRLTLLRGGSYGRLRAMKTTMDRAGRLVIPKEI